jgi:hypothetical protein
MDIPRRYRLFQLNPVLEPGGMCGYVIERLDGLQPGGIVGLAFPEEVLFGFRPQVNAADFQDLPRDRDVRIDLACRRRW